MKQKLSALSHMQVAEELLKHHNASWAQTAQNKDYHLLCLHFNPFRANGKIFPGSIQQPTRYEVVGKFDICIAGEKVYVRYRKGTVITKEKAEKIAQYISIARMADAA